jgi:hypothetical protein
MESTKFKEFFFKETKKNIKEGMVESLKTAILYPIHKKESREIIKNYRPIM